MTNRERFVRQVKSCVGIFQGSDGHRAIIDTYNRINPLPRGYKMKYTDPWCAAFVSACGQSVNLVPHAIYPECSCYQMLREYQKANLWIEDDNYLPKEGDLVFYSWADNDEGDCTAMPDHVGVVVGYGINSVSLDVVEGNYNKTVAFRNVPIGGRYIRGFATPAFTDEDEDNWEVEREEAKEWAIKNGLIKGDGVAIDWDADVKLWQVAMILNRLVP